MAVEQLTAERKRLTRLRDSPVDDKSVAKRPAAETAADPQAVPKRKRHRDAERPPHVPCSVVGVH